MKITKKISTFAIATALALGGLFAFAAPTAYAATDPGCPDGWESNHGTCVPPSNNDVEVWDVVQTALNWILAIIGVIATIMIILGGIQYTTSAGDSGKVKKAKDTILYGIIGLVIALLAAAIVNFVLDGIFSSDGGDGDDDASVSTTYVA